MKLSKDDLVNCNEPRVLKAVEEFIESGKTAHTCRSCVLDLAALSLNRVPPRYIVDPYAKYGEPIDERPSDEEIANIVKLMARTVEQKPHAQDCAVCGHKKK